MKNEHELVAFDPWSHLTPATLLTARDRQRMHPGARPPARWHLLARAVRAALCGVAAEVLARHGAESASASGKPDCRYHLPGKLMEDLAERVEQATTDADRKLWRTARMACQDDPELGTELFSALSGAGGAIGALLLQRQQIDMALASLGCTAEQVRESVEARVAADHELLAALPGFDGDEAA